MIAPRTISRLVRCYPPAWRSRYGEELEVLLLDSSAAEGIPWRTQVDVVLAGGRERLRAAEFGDGGVPADRARAGALLVLCAWALFIMAGAAVQKVSEHWQAAMPAASRALPSAAFDVLVVAAVGASALVASGIAASLPTLARFLKDGGGATIRRHALGAAVLSAAALAATVVLVMWARGLTGSERAGHDGRYAAGFVGWALLVTACLGAWTVLAVTTARRLPLPVATLALLARLACAVAVAMSVMSAATVVWWAALANAAPWFLSGRPAGVAGSPFVPQLAAAAALMVLATVLGGAGARRAMRALPALNRPAS